MKEYPKKRFLRDGLQGSGVVLGLWYDIAAMCKSYETFCRAERERYGVCRETV